MTASSRARRRAASLLLAMVASTGLPPALDRPAASAEPPVERHLAAPVEGEDYTRTRTAAGRLLTVPTDLSDVTAYPPLAPSVRVAEAPGRRAPQRRTARLLDDGAWSFYMNPRVLQTARATYVGTVTSGGTVRATRLAAAGNRLDHVALGRVPSGDDHTSPTFVQSGAGRIAAFWSGHGDRPVRYKLSVAPDSVRFGRTRQLSGSGLEHENATYTVVLPMTGEARRHWLLTRIVEKDGVQQAWWLTTSDDLVRWTSAVQLTRNPHPRLQDQSWPYLRVVGSGYRTLDIAITDGDPSALRSNSLFHIRYTHGRFVRSDGSLIRTMADLRGGRGGADPLDPREGTLIHNGSGPEGTARVYDITRGPGDRLAVAMTTHSTRTGTRTLKWFRHTGLTWQGSTIQRRWNGRPPQGFELVHGAPNHACLVSLRPGEDGREVQEWWTEDRGRTWRYRTVAGGRASTYRTPVAPWGSRTPDRGPAATQNPVLWFAGRYRSFDDFRTRVELETTGPLPVWVRATAARRPGTTSRRVTVRLHQGVSGRPVRGAELRVTWTYPRRGVPEEYAGQVRRRTVRVDRSGRWVSNAYQPPGTRVRVDVPAQDGFGVAVRTVTLR